MRNSTIRRSSVLAVAIGALCGLSFATHAIADEPKAVNVVAGNLDEALESLAKQCGVDVIYPSSQLKGIKTNGVSGVLETRAAFQKLIEGTPLVLKEERGAMLITLARRSSAAQTPEKRLTRLAQAVTGIAESSALGSEQQTASSDRNADAKKAIEAEVVPVSIPDILVVGSRILNADIQRTEDDAQPYMVFDRVEIERSGARNVEDFLMRRLTASTSSTTNDKTASSAVIAGGLTPILGNTSSINLRGLGADQTLILVDGRRIAGFAILGTPAQPDVNGIPLAAIERIEVLPATASGIYGGGATGGVINIVLRRDYDGADVKLTYGNTFDGGGEQNQVDLSAGFSLEEGRTSILFAGSYSDTDELTVGDRDLLARGQARIRATNPSVLLGGQPAFGATTNISSVSVGGIRPNLTLDNGTPLGLPITFVPEGYAGPASDGGAGLVANAGKYNFNLADTAGVGGARQSLLNAPTVKSVNLTARREFTSWLDAYIELATSENKGVTDRGLSSTFVLDGAAADNPFRETIRVTTPILGVDNIVESIMERDRAAAGLIVSLPWNWRAQADYLWDRTDFSFSQPSILMDNAKATADIASGAISIFRDTNIAPVDFTPYLISDQSSGVETTLDNVALRFSGPLPLLLPGGAATLSLLFEYRKEEIGDQTLSTPLPPPFPSLSFLVASRSQSVNSAYLELRLPIVSAENAVPAVNLLEVQLAGRYDDYETNGANQAVPLSASGAQLAPVLRDTNRFSSGNPTFGVRYKPLSDVMLRASYGTGFLPPSVHQIVPDAAPSLVRPFNFVLFGLHDPRRGGEFVGASLPPGQNVLLFTGGNPDLDPEESESWSAGVVATPRFVPGLRISADWTRTEKTDNIGLVSPFLQTNLDLEQQIPGLVTRDTNPATFGAFGVGPIIALDSRLRNIARTQVEAYDFNLQQRWTTQGFGEFAFSAAATHFERNESQAVPLAPVLDTAGTIEGLRLRANATLSWTYKNWAAAWTTRYFDSYRLLADGLENDPSATALITTQGSASVPSQIYHDLFASFRFESQAGLFSDTEISLGINNVFNTRPPFDVTGGQFYSSLGDPRLASYYVSLRKAF